MRIVAMCNSVRFAIFSALVMLFCIRGEAARAADVELWRLDCGEFADFPLTEMSDDFAYKNRTLTLTDSCYLVRHGSEYMLWNTGFSPAAIQAFNTMGLKSAMRETLPAQLSRLGIDPKKIAVVGISHFHPDHTGQAALFPQARLLMGKADFEFLAQSKSVDVAPWLTEKSAVEAISGDRDVFGDGSVVMLATPGHTLGHHSLLVRLSQSGAVILAGDLWHFSEQVKYNRMPAATADRAAELASMDRILRAAAHLKAKIIIEHEKGDIAKLPLFPASAR
jgi:N-acyl homoserine lactone hydrolase